MMPCLSKVFILREDSRGNIVHQLKLSPELASTFHSWFGKHAFTMASIFLNDHKGKAPQSLDQHAFEDWTRSEGDNREDGELQDRLIDFLKKNPHLDKQLRTKNLESALQVVQSSKKGAQAGQEILKFPDGYSWVKVSDCGEEGSLMQHCGQDSEGDMYSLRDKNNMPHVTLTMDDSPDHYVHQIKGKQNAAPDKKYWKHIGDFIKKTHEWHPGFDWIVPETGSNSDKFDEYLNVVLDDMARGK